MLLDRKSEYNTNVTVFPITIYIQYNFVNQKSVGFKYTKNDFYVYIRNLDPSTSSYRSASEFTKQKTNSTCDKQKYSKIAKNALAKVENKVLFSQLLITKINIFQKFPLSICFEELNMTQLL